MIPQPSLIGELEDAIKNGSQEKRVDALRRVTDLFLQGADRLDESQVGVFDNVLGCLIERIESKAMAELSGRLAPVKNAPADVIRRLAQHDEIAVAGPVLTQSTRLTANDLVDIAKTKGQQHLLAISGRRELSESVTDVLLDRGERQVSHALASNAGARFSTGGYATLVKKAADDEGLAEQIGMRIDVPKQLLPDLLAKATEAVRARLLAQAPAETRDEIQRVVAAISNEVGRTAGATRNFDVAKKLVSLLQTDDELDEKTLYQFATERKYEEMVAALAAMSSASIDVIEPLMASARNDGLLIPCKAAGIKWPTVCAILNGRSTFPVADLALAQARTEYLTLSQASASRILRFWQVRAGAAKAAG